MTLEELKEKNKILKSEDVLDFKPGIQNGYLNWKVQLKDYTIHQIYYKYIEHTTKAGNKGKIKIYYIRTDEILGFKDDDILVFDDKLKKEFIAYKRPYLISGI